ncbi:hypothetical protein JCM21900_005262 [Sporobolomyces salmonicolor]
MLGLLRSFSRLTSRSRPPSAMPASRAHSPPTPPPDPSAEPPAKRQRLDQPVQPDRPRPDPAPAPPIESVEDTLTQKPRSLPYAQGMHLAPMVRIGTLPVRLLALDYGAELVWGPEIVDKAIIGATRTVDPKSGVISYLKNNRSIFECHPVEKPRLIFQLGSASPELAVEAIKVIQQDVAGIGLNCGCPKSFSLQGGMGAALLKDPERLCAILKAMVAATDLPIDAKIRLLPLPKETPSVSSAAPSPAPGPDSVPPSPSSSSSLVPPTLLVPETPVPTPSEPTLPLVSRIFSTGIANLTVHCRTQEMRSSEPALHERMREITAMGRETGVPVVCNGDAVGGGSGAGWGNFGDVCKKTGVSSVMIARAAEANPSCFSREGLEDPISVVIPRLLRIAIATQNHFGNTKYILNAINLHMSPTPPSRERNRDIKQRMNKARTYDEMAQIFGITQDEVERLGNESVEGLVPKWVEKRREMVEREGEP